MATNLGLEFAHAVIYVCDADKMIDFYTRVLGFEVTDRGHLGPSDGPEIIFLSQAATHHHQVAFLTTREHAGDSNSINHLAFRSAGTLDDLRDLNTVLEAEPEIEGIRPRTHGNAWSVYFQDPEGNGVEIFIDSPWHVVQPQGRPIDFGLSNDEITARTEAEFRDEDQFGPLADFYSARAKHLAARNG